MQSLEKSAKEKSEAGFEEQEKILNLLSRSASMMLDPNSLNEPFKPYYQDYQAGRRSALSEDFTEDDLIFFEEMLQDLEEPWLRARLADLLWLCKTPKNPNHAKAAIESYISHSIDSDTWHRDVNDCWERAARLCMQIKDVDRLDDIKNQLFSSFKLEHSNSKFMTLWIANLMDKLNIDSDFREYIASALFNSGKTLLESGDFNSARSYFELSSKKFKHLAMKKPGLILLLLWQIVSSEKQIHDLLEATWLQIHSMRMQCKLIGASQRSIEKILVLTTKSARYARKSQRRGQRL